MAQGEVKLPPGFVLDAPKVPDGFVLDTPTQRAPVAKVGLVSRVVKGLRDPIDAGAQIISHAVPDVATDVLDYIPKRMRESDSPALQTIGESFFADPRAKAMDARLAADEARYQQGRGPDGGIDWSRIAGNVLSPVNVAIGAKVPRAVGLAKRLVTAAATGAGYGALASPVTEGDFVKEKGKQIALGAAVGPAVELVGSAAGRMIAPKTGKDVKALMAEGITPTPGQILGGRWQAAEDKLTSVPILGDAISSARGKSLDELNRAVYARVLQPIGGTAPKSVGREAIGEVRKQIGKAYDDLLPKTTFRADKQFLDDLATIETMVDNLPPEHAARFEKVLRGTVFKKFSRQGTMDGKALKGLESELGEVASGLKRDALFDNRQLGAAIGEIQAAVRSNLERSNPLLAKELNAVNTSWANYSRLRDAAARQGAESGKFTPAQLSAAVRAQDKSKGKRAFSEGTALMQDLSDPAKGVLPGKYPDSGTVGRLLLGLGIGGGATVINPLAAGIGAASTLPYLPGGRSTMAALLARRPQGAEQVAGGVRKAIPRLTPALIELLKRDAVQNGE